MSLPSAPTSLEEVVSDALTVAGEKVALLRRGLSSQPAAMWVLLLLALLAPLLPIWGWRSYHQARERFQQEQERRQLARERIIVAALERPLAQRDRAGLEALLRTAMLAGSLQSLAVADGRGRELLRQEVAGARPVAGESRWWPTGATEGAGGLWLRRAEPGDRQLLAVLDDQLLLAWGVAGLALVLAFPMAALLLRWRQERQRARALRLAAEAERLALEDSLTGMVNRRGIDAVLTELIEGVAGHPAAFVAVCLIDLDDFGRIVEREGAQRSDRLLRDVATRLRHCARSGDIVGRLGSDVFLCVLDPCTIPEAPVLLADRILQALARPFPLEGGELSLGASIGIVLADGNALLSPSILLYRADAAMQTAKAEGKNRWHQVRLEAAPPLDLLTEPPRESEAEPVPPRSG